jgi:hypothetical protein
LDRFRFSTQLNRKDKNYYQEAEIYSLRSRNIAVSGNENELENTCGSCPNDSNKKIDEYLVS